MKNINWIPVLLLSVNLIACQYKPSSAEKATIDASTAQKESELYTHLVDRGWSTSLVKTNPDRAEQLLADFFAACGHSDSSAIVQGGKELIASLEDAADKSFVLVKMEHYLYNPNSPMRNERSLDWLLQAFLEDEGISDTDRQRYTQVKELVAKNNVGTKATDFDFKNIDGSNGTLYGLQAPFRLLLFYDPTCHTCEEVMNLMTKADFLNKLIDTKKMQILTVNVMGNESLWKQGQSKLSSKWINGWDSQQQVLLQQRYNIQAYPTLYLLDAGHKVLLKDVELSLAANYLYQQIR